MEKIDIYQRFLPDNESEIEMLLSVQYTYLAEALNEAISNSRELTVAMERLEESYMWVKKAVENNGV
jgi:hypothetical protein